MGRLSACAWLAIAGCSRAHPGPAVPGATREVEFSGMCDASAAVALSARLFAVADDEGNVLRVYDADRGGPPLWSVELSEGLDLPQEVARKNPSHPSRAPELDLEAATRVGDHAFWLTSHARSRSGKRKPERQRFFATPLPLEGAPARLIGRAYETLVVDLAADPRFAAFGLEQAAELGPREPGGLNIEGMTVRVEGGVWIGFRSPVPDGRALLVPLLDPEEVIAGERPRFGDPVRLDLGGLGVRDLSWWHGQYLIVAGHTDGSAPSQLYTWDGRDAPRAATTLDFRRFNPEAFFSPEERDEILLLSDDGSLELHGTHCKNLKDGSQKRFRGAWVTLPQPS